MQVPSFQVKPFASFHASLSSHCLREVVKSKSQNNSKNTYIAEVLLKPLERRHNKQPLHKITLQKIGVHVWSSVNIKYRLLKVEKQERASCREKLKEDKKGSEMLFVL